MVQDGIIQDGIIPLMHASKTGELEVVKILLQKFAKIDIEENVYSFCSVFALPVLIYTNSSSRTFNGLSYFTFGGKYQIVLDFYLEYHKNQPDGIYLTTKSLYFQTAINLAS